MTRLSQSVFIGLARDGEPEWMPGALCALADRLRVDDLDADERAFLADALERIGKAADPEKEAPRALLLTKPRGRTTPAASNRVAIDRARRVLAAREEGTPREAAIARVADEDGVDDSQVRKAWDRWKGALASCEE